MFENAKLAELVIGRSTVRQRILALLLAGQPTRLHLREIQRRVGTSPGTASRELARLVAAGLIERQAEGSQVYFRAADGPAVAMMRQLLLLRPDGAIPSPPRRIRTSRRTKPSAEALLAEAATPAAEARDSAVAAAASAEVRDSISDSPAAAAAGQPGAPSTPAVPAPAAPASEIPAAPASSPGRFAAPSDPLALVVAARFTAAIRPLYHDRLKAVFLYGARASGPASDDADIELLIVLDTVDRYGDELELTSSICAQLSLELGLVVSRIFAAEGAWSSPRVGFVPVVPAGETAP
jgi:DNA-binding transcriptional ArsR family regulator